MKRKNEAQECSFPPLLATFADSGGFLIKLKSAEINDVARFLLSSLLTI